MSENKEEIIKSLLELREIKIKELWDINQEINDLETKIKQKRNE